MLKCQKNKKYIYNQLFQNIKNLPPSAKISPFSKFTPFEVKALYFAPQLRSFLIEENNTDRGRLPFKELVAEKGSKNKKLLRN